MSPAGTLDASFDPGNGPSATVYALGVASDSNIVIGGAFTSYNGTTAGRIARLSAATGARDSSFNVGNSGFDNSVRALRLGSDGKFYVGGSFSTFNRIQRSQVARLNNDGSLDSSFVPTGLSFFSTYALALQGFKTLAGGLAFPSSVPFLRLNGDGAPDSIFQAEAAFSPANAYISSFPTISALAMQSEMANRS